MGVRGCVRWCGDAEVGVESEGLLPVVVGLVAVTDGVVGVGETVVGVGLFVAVPDFGGQGECGGVLGVCLVELPVGVLGLSEAVQDPGFACPVIDLAGDCEGLLVVVGG